MYLALLHDIAATDELWANITEGTKTYLKQRYKRAVRENDTEKVEDMEDVYGKWNLNP